MSGGYFDYGDRELFDIEESIVEWLAELKNEEQDLDFDELKYFGRRILQDVKHTREALRALDYYLSCDTCEETFIEECRALYHDDVKLVRKDGES